jgi:mRNA degradation ribonuclease J1/J2
MDETKKVVFIHSVPATVISMKKKIAEIFPDVQLINILDDGFLPEIERNKGRITAGIVSRIFEYVRIAQDYGAKAVICLCTTIAPVMQIASQGITIPALQIDYPMMEQAVQAGSRIAIICTAKYTMNSSLQTAGKAAEKYNRQVDITPVFVENAFEAAQIEGDMEKHDKLIIDKAESIAGDYDVFVLAQVSMGHLVEKMAHIGKPVFSSIPSGLTQLQMYL